MAGSNDERGSLASSGGALRAGKDQGVALAHGRVVGVAGDVEVLEALRVVQALADHPGRHQAAGLLGVETDDLELAVLLVLEDRVTTRAWSRLASMALKYSLEARLTSTGLPLSATAASRASVRVPFQKA